MLNNALIGSTGFVGSTLMNQICFDEVFHSTDIHTIRHKRFDTVICAGAPAQKWRANNHPEEDKKTIDALVSCLRTIECRRFILISTADVFENPVGCYEDTPVVETGLHPYGLHRRQLEKFVVSHFLDPLILRLPGLVGTGLRKNIVFDLLNHNNLDKIDSSSVYQFYPMVRLSHDIRLASRRGLLIAHLTAEPISVESVAKYAFGVEFNNRLDGMPVTYDMRTRHAELFGGTGSYLYSVTNTLDTIRYYVLTEPVTMVSTGGQP